MPVLSTNNLNFANVFVQQSGVQVTANYIHVKQSGKWNKVSDVYRNVNGTWLQIWPTTGVVLFDRDATITVPPGINYATILVIGGGGGGGQGKTAQGHNGAGGGGGGGGVVYEQGIPVTASEKFIITIGKGGAGAASNSGNGGADGGDTSITGCVSGTPTTYTAHGGTGGSGFNGPHGPSVTTSSGCCSSYTTYSPYIGPGGSGGGGYSTRDSPGISPPTPGGAQGYAGGYGATNNSIDAGGGGGGAGGQGGAAAVGVGGSGGVGIQNNITGQCTYYAGGGAGGVTNPGQGTGASGGLGGGGDSGQDATYYGGGGGGGGAGSDSSVGPASGNGHDGAVIVNFYSRYNGAVKLETDSGTGKINVPTGREISYTNTCFDPKALVYMADGTYKMIKDIVVGDKVVNSKGGVNTVIGIETPVLGTRLMYKFNNHWAFVSEEHPLLTTQGWAAFDPDSSAVEAPFKGNLKKITIGTELVKFDGTETVASISTETQDPDYVIYNLSLDGDHTYIVEGFVVHNKDDGCFAEDAVVSMADGSFKDIADVQVGDKVYNYNKTSVNQVVYIESVYNDTLPMYSPSDEFVPFATLNHPLYIDGVLTTPTADYPYPWLDVKNTIDAITAPISHKTVYNLWVTGDHTYVVNGYGTHSIIDDGGFLPELIERNKLTHDEAMQSIRICTSAGIDIMYGSYIFIKLFKKIPALWIKTFFARSLLTESIAQKFVLSVFKVSGKIANLIKQFR